MTARSNLQQTERGRNLRINTKINYLYILVPVEDVILYTYTFIISRIMNTGR